jgi:hypothetical protein
LTISVKALITFYKELPRSPLGASNTSTSLTAFAFPLGFFLFDTSGHIGRWQQDSDPNLVLTRPATNSR